MRQQTAYITSNFARAKRARVKRACSQRARSQRWSTAVCAAALALSARAQAPENHLVTRVTAELSVRAALAGTEPGDTAGTAAKLQTAERVVPGDVLIYTVEVRNAGRYAVESAVVVQPIPNHTLYVEDSAVGPGVEVDYSVDGGRSFDKPENLKSPGAEAGGQDASSHAARAAAGDYTHIRWRLHNPLKPNSIAYVRFCAQVK